MREKRQRPSKEGGWKCQCGLVFRTRRECHQHKHQAHHIIGHGNQYTLAKELGLPKPEFSEATKRKLAKIWAGKKLPDEMKRKISEGVKKAYAEGRHPVVCGWPNRDNRKSYPETWWTGVIDAEFIDKNYKCELRCGPYFIDFAWPEKMRCIEIDDEQHYRFQQLRTSDLKKDQFLTEKGWKVLRIKWSDCVKDKQRFIQLAQDFINAPVVQQ